MKSEKFNGMSLFTPPPREAHFGSTRNIMETANNLTVSDHVIDYYDIEKIIDAGHGLAGKAGLSGINFEKIQSTTS